MHYDHVHSLSFALLLEHFYWCTYKS